MITVPVEDLVFILCTLVGGGLLLVTVLVDDILGGVLDALHIGFDIGGVSLMPLALGFVSMFGVGGLFATQVLDVHGGQAAVIGTVSGALGFGIVFVMFTLLKRSEGRNPFSTATLVGKTASVAITIPAGRYGSVWVKAEGQTHEFGATASVEIPAGSTVTVTGIAGTGLIVEPLRTSTPAAPEASVESSTPGGNEGA
jgi:membrane protein implicated in regulation of membrane protease activity